MKLKFESGKNTKLVSFKVDPQTSKNLNAIRNTYSKESKRRVTTGEIVKQLINLHHKELFDNDSWVQMQENMLEKQYERNR
tara:strand:- start:229 stop:471 length:243 start_codon:yes stop_codon:yes gene_type:complete